MIERSVQLPVKLAIQLPVKAIQGMSTLDVGLNNYDCASNSEQIHRP
ncbi:MULTISPECIES: hypothetical protein [Moorena]|nr:MULTISPECIES: hypothetical protein [Moorena]NET66060.1 hypothetical protein [Moorena sp. SIO1G6]NEP31560.1 hypothetical protein [Moorena sp. SIO3B2]NEP68889.1 hypothetical protein [Moorena sp. SIO3A5]NEQ10054.1 hypothetical protein [Moorena sp. SIO4E2]NER91446.1 hypothetical protein [Moorena sp. SIO3A2]